MIGAAVSSNPTHDNCAGSHQQIVDRSIEEIPIEVVNGPKKILITTTGAYEMNRMEPSGNPFDARIDASAKRNDFFGLYKFLETVSANNVWDPSKQPDIQRPTRYMAITGANDADGLAAPNSPLVFDNNFDEFAPNPLTENPMEISQRQPSPSPMPTQNAPFAIFDNNFGNFAPNSFSENQMVIPQRQPLYPPLSLLPFPPLAMLGFVPSPNFIVNFRPILFTECTNCMFSEEIRRRPPFPIYNYNFNNNFDQMNAIVARETYSINKQQTAYGNKNCAMC